MVEVRRLTTEEVRSRLAELDAKHPTWAAIYDDPDRCTCCFAYEDGVEYDPDALEYETMRWFAEAGE